MIGNPLVVHALGCMDLGNSFALEGNRDRALHYYGRAVNDYLEAGLYDLADEACERMIDRFPDVVRARFTRAALAIGRGMQDDDAALAHHARAEIAEYVLAAQAARQQLRAIAQLRQLAEHTDRRAVVELLAEQMTVLGKPQDAREILAAFERRQAGGAEDRTDPRERWAPVLRGAG